MTISSSRYGLGGFRAIWDSLEERKMQLMWASSCLWRIQAEPSESQPLLPAVPRSVGTPAQKGLKPVTNARLACCAH